MHCDFFLASGYQLGIEFVLYAQKLTNFTLTYLMAVWTGFILMASFFCSSSQLTAKAMLKSMWAVYVTTLPLQLFSFRQPRRPKLRQTRIEMYNQRSHICWGSSGSSCIFLPDALPDPRSGRNLSVELSPHHDCVVLFQSDGQRILDYSQLRASTCAKSDPLVARRIFFYIRKATLRVRLVT